MSADAKKISRPIKGTGSSFSGLARCIFGGLMTIVYGIAAFRYPSAGLVDERYMTQMPRFVLLLAGLLLLYSGIDRYRLYQFSVSVKVCVKDKTRTPLFRLASATQRDLSSLVYDLRRLADRGVFPGAYVDLHRQDYVLYDDDPPPAEPNEVQLRETQSRSVLPIYAFCVVWAAYALSFPFYRLRDLLFAALLSIIAAAITAHCTPRRSRIVEALPDFELPQEPEPIDTGNTELDEVLTTAMGYMNELTALDVAITNERIDGPVQEMVHICKQIFDYVGRNPVKVKQIRQFMNYYLPTTIKLLKNYDELSREPVKGENIKATMRRIEDSILIIKKAFQKELDDLYRDKAMDISVDIEVLENMLQQEGLTGQAWQPGSQKPNE